MAYTAPFSTTKAADSNSGKLFEIIQEYQSARKEARERMHGINLLGKKSDIATVESLYRAKTKKQLEEMRASINRKRAELLKKDAMLDTLSRNIDDFIRYDSDPDARRRLARGIGSKRNIEKRDAITNKEQLFDVLSNGELTGDRLREFLETVDA